MARITFIFFTNEGSGLAFWPHRLDLAPSPNLSEKQKLSFQTAGFMQAQITRGLADSPCTSPRFPYWHFRQANFCWISSALLFSPGFQGSKDTTNILEQPANMNLFFCAGAGGNFFWEDGVLIFLFFFFFPGTGWRYILIFPV